MNGLSDEQLTRLADAITRGYSRSQIAKYAGVCERTAAQYRSYLELPEFCGCGRPLKHIGQCTWRRKQAKVTPPPKGEREG